MQQIKIYLQSTLLDSFYDFSIYYSRVRNSKRYQKKQVTKEKMKEKRNLAVYASNMQKKEKRNKNDAYALFVEYQKHRNKKDRKKKQEKEKERKNNKEKFQQTMLARI